MENGVMHVNFHTFGGCAGHGVDTQEPGTLRMAGVLGAFCYSCHVAPKWPPQISQAPQLRGTGLAGVELKTRFVSPRAAGISSKERQALAGRATAERLCWRE